jgi:hypothetical protein
MVGIERDGAGAIGMGDNHIGFGHRCLVGHEGAPTLGAILLYALFWRTWARGKFKSHY